MSEATAVEFADWLAIRELTATYNRCFDEADAEGWARTFTPAGRLEVIGGGIACTGWTELADFCRSRGWGYLHMTLDPRIRVEEALARQECNLLMLRRRKDQSPPTLLATGRYTDGLVRTPAGWRFAERRIELDNRLDGPGGQP
ncbi:nuclear transport factor 2 family protein [Streptomyces sp. NPDC002596]